ncbi:MAG: RNA degradosome polyphosphate kinase, partial [Holophagales bacterium]|nr:RNA degradosome polyphosphate kinase [Holophagales bacterium]
MVPGLPEHYINRELSWLRFNSRVLEEARESRHPLLERVKFLSIYGSNLDEFFMVRVAGLVRQLERGALEAPADGMTPSEQLAGIRSQLERERRLVYGCWHDDL